MKRYLNIILVSICLIIFSIISLYVVKDWDIYLDSYIHNVIYNNIVSDGMTSFMKVISMLGSGYVIISTAIIVIFIIRDNRERFNITLCLLFSSLFNNIILKGIFRRDRPIYMMIKRTDYSYPSGHSMVSTVFYGYLIYLVYKHINNKIIRNVLICLLSIIIFLICFSRIYLGVHYFSDVIGGILIGIIFLIGFIYSSKKINKIN